ncbi:MAG: hydroxyacylglutathione hydrolase, partial [Bdellovibrionales bacterium]|nr:hydroxyacylglutathione hydrolase [Bdellovibrionales bacterium]
VELVPAFLDNYIFILTDEETGKTAVVDPGESSGVLKALANSGKRLDSILLTHHHFDHVGGVSELRQKYGCEIYGSEEDQHRLPPLSRSLKDQDSFSIGKSWCSVIEVPGHTLGHIAFWFPEDKILFCGDTLFSLGCGRLFEGSPQQMWHSLQKIRSLPEESQIYCAHEYTLANGKFASYLEPENEELAAYLQKAKEMRSLNQPTIPCLLKMEKKLNPFLKPLSPPILSKLGIYCSDPLEAFTQLRLRKDSFVG